MSLWRHATRGLRSLLHRRGADRDLADEVAHYFEEAAASRESAGLSPEEARRAIRVEFGRISTVQEQVRAYGWENALERVGAELRYGARQLYRRPAFALAAALTLALGIGATTAIFSVVYSVIIQPLPYPNAGELVRIRHNDIHGERVFSETMYLTYREENRTLASIGLWHESSAMLTGRGEPEIVRALRVTDGTLQALGVQPIRGRLFTAQEYGPAAGGPEPVVLSHGFWQRRFGGDAAVLGRALSMEAPSGARATPLAGQWQVVGIMPPDFRFLDMAPQPDVIVAMRLDPSKETINSFSYDALARLAPGVTAAAARADLQRLLPIWIDAWPIVPGATLTKDAIRNWRITPVVRPLKDDLVAGVASALWVLMGAIGAVLLIACANIANLLLVRADARQQEFAVRAALGAAPARIARELLAESLVLGAAGGVLGLGLAYAGVRVLVAIGPSHLPRLEEIAVHPPVLVFTVAVALASSLVFGAIPALRHALRLDAPLTGVPRGSSTGRERSATRSALVIVQVALALALVVSATLMIRTFGALLDVDPGFADPATIHTAGISIPSGLVSGPDQAARVARMTSLQREILDRIAVRPGGVSAFASDVPMSGTGSWNGPVLVEGEALAAGDRPPPRRWNFVSPGYFAAMGTRIIAGRDVTWRDIETGGRVAVISEDFARDLAAAPAGALGRRIRLPHDTSEWHEVVGVVQDVHQDGLYERPLSLVYWPVLTANGFGRTDVTFVIRSDRAGTASLASEVRQAVRSVNATIPITFEGTMQDLFADSLARTSFALVMLAIAGSMALALGVVGIHGVIAYVVSQRTREIGIRSALGADPRQLRQMFLRHGLTLSGAGVVAGLAVAAASGRLLSSLLFGVEPMDPAAYACAIGVTLAAAALASYLPARRAAAIDPIETMKAE
jgi:predicted permease